MPVTRSGRDELTNFAALCPDCHAAAVIVGADRQVTAYVPGEFEAWLDDDLDRRISTPEYRRWLDRVETTAGGRYDE